MCVTLKPSDSFHNSLTHRKYVTKCNDKSINTLNYCTFNCIYLITYCKCCLRYVSETVQFLRLRFRGHRTGMKTHLRKRHWEIERQKKETKWILTFQTVNPYGLSDRTCDEYMTEKESTVVGKFLPLHCLYKCPD